MDLRKVPKLQKTVSGSYIIIVQIWSSKVWGEGPRKSGDSSEKSTKISKFQKTVWFIYNYRADLVDGVA